MKMIYVATMATKPDRDSQWVMAFKECGIEVITFATQDEKNYSRKTIIEKIQHRFQVGNHYKALQTNLIELVKKEKPDWVHFRLPIEFTKSTIKTINQLDIKVTQYFNDDPFSKEAVLWLNNTFKKALKLYDANFVYRQRNIKDFESAGAKNVFHCPPAYVPSRHNLKTNNFDEIFAKENIDAAFLGHWENDWRLICIDSLLKQNFKVKIHGGGWNEAIKKSNVNYPLPVDGLYGDAYCALYRQAKFGLCFFSKINRDLWTERPFEIVAVGGLLVCERTHEAATYFEDKKEAFFFSTIEELLEIAELITTNEQLSRNVRIAGFEKLKQMKHTVLDRANLIVNIVNRRI